MKDKQQIKYACDICSQYIDDIIEYFQNDLKEDVFISNDTFETSKIKYEHLNEISFKIKQLAKEDIK